MKTEQHPNEETQLRSTPSKWTYTLLHATQSRILANESYGVWKLYYHLYGWKVESMGERRGYWLIAIAIPFQLLFLWFWKMCLLLVCYVQMDGMIYLYVFWWHFYTRTHRLHVAIESVVLLVWEGKTVMWVISYYREVLFHFHLLLSGRWLIFLEFLVLSCWLFWFY